MIAMDLPREPNVITARDVKEVREIREQVQQEWEEFEEETRRIRRSRRSSRVQKAPTDELVKAAQEEDRYFLQQKAQLQKELEELRLQKAMTLRKSSCPDTRDRSGSDASTHIRDSLSSAASSAISRSSSPTGSDYGQEDCWTQRSRSEPFSEPASLATGRRPSGKGKGKGIALPPPRGGVRRPSHGTTPRTCSETLKAASKYVPLYWKVSHTPEDFEKTLLVSDPFLEIIGEVSSDDACRWPFQEVSIPSRPDTIFSRGIEIPNAQDVQQNMLDTYFKRCEATVKLPLSTTRKSEFEQMDESKYLDQKRLSMLGILLQKHIMSHRSISSLAAIEEIKRGVLQCDFNVVKLEGLSILRVVLRHHLQSGSPISAYVRRQGEAALWKLEHPEHHYLVHELTKLPQIDERLETMLFRLSYEENVRSCRLNLEILNKALKVLRDKKELLRRFFVTAHRLGQSVMQQETRGFQLSTLEKMLHTRSTKMPQFTILHFVLALMSAEDVQELFNDGDIVFLRNASLVGTQKVAEDCKELALGLYGVKHMCENGENAPPLSRRVVKIERRRSAVETDVDDCFHDVMQAFVDSRIDEVDEIALGNQRMLLLYKELAIFFDDLRSVYPPPQKESASRSDLIDIFYSFATTIQKARHEVGSLNSLITGSPQGVVSKANST